MNAFLPFGRPAAPRFGDARHRSTVRRDFVKRGSVLETRSESQDESQTNRRRIAVTGSLSSVDHYRPPPAAIEQAKAKLDGAKLGVDASDDKAKAPAKKK